MNLWSDKSITVCRALTRGTAIVAGLIGLVVLAGWTFNLPQLTSFGPGGGEVKPITALLLVATAGALALLTTGELAVGLGRRWLGRALGGAVALIGALAFVRHGFGSNPGTVAMWFRAVAEGGVPGSAQLSPLAAADFSLLGTALLLLAGRPRRVVVWTAQLGSLAATFGAFIAVTGYLYSRESLNLAPLFTNTTLGTGIILLALSVGVVAARPQEGLMALFNAATAGGAIVRRLIVPIVLLPAVINGLELEGGRRGFFPLDFGWMLDSAVTALLTGLLVWTIAGLLHRKDLIRQVALAKLHESTRQLEQERARLFEAQAVAKVGSWEIELPGRKTRWTAEMHRIYETNPVDFRITLPGFLRLVHPADRARVTAAFKVPVRRHELCALQHRIVMPDGRIKTVEERWQGRHDDRGGVDRAIGTCQDMTVHMQVIDALRDTNDTLQSIFDAAPVAVLAYDSEGCVKQWSNGAARIFGWTAMEVLDRPCPTVPEDGRADFREMIARVAEHGPESLVRVRQKKDGERIEARLNPAPWRNRDGRTNGIMVILEDITERRRTEEALRRSEAEFASAFDDASIGMALVTPDGRWLRANRSLCAVLGYSVAELRTRTFQDLTHPDDLAADLTEVGRMLAGEITTFRLEKRYFHQSGRLVWALLSVSLVRDDQGRPLHFVSQIQDITERKAAAEALRDSEQRLANLIDIAADAIVLVDESQRIGLFNKGAEAIFGYRAAEVLGQPLSLLLPARFAAEHGRHLPNFAAAPEAARRMNERSEVFGRRKDGSEFPAEASIAKQRDGGKSSLTVILRDITDRKAADETIRENERALRLIAAATNDALWNWDVINSKVQRNAGFEKHFGYPADVIEPTIEWWSERVHPDDRMVAGAIMREASEGKADDGFYRYRFRRRDGSFATINDHVCFVRDKSGKTVRALGAMTDVTTQVEAEANLRLVLQRLMVAEQDERRRIARELHDSTVQDLVAAMINLEFLREQTAGRTEDEVRQIEDGLALLENSAHEIRTLSYLLHPPLLDETGLIGAIRHYVNGVGERTGLTTSVNIPAELSRLDGTVELILFRVMQESLGNTHRHAQAKMAAVRMRQDSRETVLEISDDGRGIPSQILEPGTMDGLGVGIPGMRERLRQIGGRMEIESNGGGTTVRAIVPATKGEP